MTRLVYHHLFRLMLDALPHDQRGAEKPFSCHDNNRLVSSFRRKSSRVFLRFEQRMRQTSEHSLGYRKSL